nr:alpha-L-rhamnosidase C-terminal domain-containing protein [Nocardioides thalensis]
MSGSANSASHGWGSQAVVDVLDSVLGIEITAPGAAEVTFSVPDTGLAHAEGSRMTQRGRVSSAWTTEDGALTLDVEVPVSVSGIVELPAGDYEVMGPDGAAAKELGTADGLTRYRVGSGAWTFAG